MDDRPLYLYPRAKRLSMVQQWAGRYVTIMHAPLRNQSTPRKITGRCLTVAVMMHGTTSDVVIIGRPNDYPLGISLAQIVSIGALT